MKKDIISKISKVLEERKRLPKTNSYTKRLYERGVDEILKKVEEETLELIKATKDVSKYREKKIVHEVADLWFHTMVLLSNENINPLKVLKELESRFGISGIVEKNSRKKKKK